MGVPILPPLLNAIEVSDNPNQNAIERVLSQKAGAGDFFWARSNTTANVAIVLEPEVGRARCLEMVPLTMVAVSDCLAVLLPPQVAIQFRDEKSVVINGGVVGYVEMAMAASFQNNVPDWLVISVNLEMVWTQNDGDPGEHPEITVLSEEGWEDPNFEKFIETFARHFLSWMVNWSDDGFDAISRAWKFKAENQCVPDMTIINEQMKLFGSSNFQ